ncbi:hypothetical protein [Streptomyces qinglanensis]|uniref:hypothetical protein n=1 Tax=Streptomyces qinglanensis TaxID=943816 RepID=UPI003D746891
MTTSGLYDGLPQPAGREPMTSATGLSAEELTGLRARARREAGPFVDPHVIRAVVPHTPAWASAILGRPYSGARSLTWPERYLLHIAAEAEPATPPAGGVADTGAGPSAELAAARKEREERRARAVTEWEEIRRRLPVAAEVRHNYTSHRHLGHYSQGGDHIYLPDGLTAGRLIRPARSVLCWTPSRARDLREFPEPAGDGRPPSCRACLRIARRLTTPPAAGSGTRVPSRAQLELLKHIARGYVVRVHHARAGWAIRLTTEQSRGRGGSLGRNVTTAARALLHGGWAREGGHDRRRGYVWHLTDAGSAHLSTSAEGTPARASRPSPPAPRAR